MFGFIWLLRIYVFLSYYSFWLSNLLYRIDSILHYLTQIFPKRLASDDWENPHPCDDEPEELETIWNLVNCGWLTAGSIMQQGCDILPKFVF